ncbi:MAG TPA: hypothetical protein VGM56_21585, partial [Byssovorax sp.]
MLNIALDANNIYASNFLAVTNGAPCSDAPRIAAFSRATGAESTVVACGAAAGAGDDVYRMVLANGTLYWNPSAGDPNAALLELFRVPTQGGVPTALGVESDGEEFAVDATSVYYSNSNGGVARANLDGSGAVPISSLFARVIAVDDANVYLGVVPCPDDGCSTPPSIYALPKAGGPQSTLVDETPGVDQMIARDAYLYWTVLGSKTKIFRVSTQGGPVETLVDENTGESVVALSADSTYLYGVTSGTGNPLMHRVLRVPLAGGTPTVLATEPGIGTALAVDDTAIVWSAKVAGVPNSGVLYTLA